MTKIYEEVTMKDIILKMKEWWKFFWRKWLWFFSAGLICGVLAMIYVWNQKPTYTATLNFILSSDNSQNSSILGLASQLGVDLSSNTDAFAGDNIITLMSSRTMVQKALLQMPPGSKQTLLNIYVKDEKLNDSWHQKERTKNAYPFPVDATKMNYVQDSLLRDVYLKIINDNLTVQRPDKDISVYVVATKSNNEIFSLYLTKYLVQSTSKFYIDTKTSVSRSNLTMLQHEADSIYSILTHSIASSARVYDYTFNLNPAYQAQRVPAQQSQLMATAEGTAYSEVLRNLELAKINLQKDTPLYQVIDEPQLPLIAEKNSRLVALIVGGFAGVFLMLLYFIIKGLFKLAD